MKVLKKNWVIIVFSFSLLFFWYTKFYKNKQPVYFLDVKTYQTPIGWGYDIVKNDSIIIHQNVIPGIAGRKGFSDKEEAEKTAILVLKKIKNKAFPIITLRELDSMHIHY